MLFFSHIDTFLKSFLVCYNTKNYEEIISNMDPGVFQSPVTKATSSGMFAFCIKFLSWFGFATRQEVKDDNFVKTADKKVTKS